MIPHFWRALFTALLAAQGLLVAANDEKTFYTVVIPEGVPADKLQIHYLMSGGRNVEQYGELKGETSTRQFEIPVNMTGTDVASLEAVIFCPGYETILILDEALASSTRRQTLRMKPLPMLRLAGTLVSADSLPLDGTLLRIIYIGDVGLYRRHNMSRAPQHFQVAATPLQPDGTFAIDVHDFAHDPPFQLAARWRDGALKMQIFRPGDRPPIFNLTPDPKDVSGLIRLKEAYPERLFLYATKGPFPRAMR